MKTFIFAAALSFPLIVARAQEAPPVPGTGAEPKKEQKEQPRAFLGITMIAKENVVVVDFVHPDSPAAKAGMEAGVAILSIDGKPVKGEPDVVNDAIRAKKPGDEIELWWWDNGDRVSRIALESRAEVDRQFAELKQTVKESRQHAKEGAISGVELDPFKEADSQKVPKYNLRFNANPFTLDAGPVVLEESGASAKAPEKTLPDNKDDWDQVQKRVAGALEKSDLDTGAKEKVLKALEYARGESALQQARQAKLEGAISALEKSVRDLQERAGKLRQELEESRK